MELNENIIKNIANEITRNCQAKNVIVETDFVVHLIGLLLLNPKHSKLLAKSSNRNNLEIFVNTCVSLLTSGHSSLNTLKIQHIYHTNYDRLNNLMDNHKNAAEACLKPLINEIVDTYPDMEDEGEIMKLFRKISIYIILASGLGNPSAILTLKEGMAALDSVFTSEDLTAFIDLPREDKISQLWQLAAIVSGVRLFNKDCKKGGEGIQDLPFDLEDAIKACSALLSNRVMSLMQCINSMTTAIDDVIVLEEENGHLLIQPKSGVTSEDYRNIFNYLAFYRQLEVYVRQLLADTEVISQEASVYVEQLKRYLKQVHDVVKYKSAVPVVTVFPLFVQVWHVWHDMQNLMYLISTINNVLAMLTTQQDCVKLPANVLKLMLNGKTVMTDQDRVNRAVGLEVKMSIVNLRNFMPFSENNLRDNHIQYLGFCAVCVCKGALVPCNPRLGVMKVDSNIYGFCTAEMAAQFNHDPQRYINRALEYIRNNPHLINLLDVVTEVRKVRHIEELVAKIIPKITYYEKDVQTELHPVPEKIVKDYVWNLWEYKKRACQWATIVNCRTHSTQTRYSHLRSEIQCQTTENRDKCLQTRRDNNMNTMNIQMFHRGLRGRYSEGQVWKFVENMANNEPLKPKSIELCPCSGKLKARLECASTPTEE